MRHAFDVTLARVEHDEAEPPAPPSPFGSLAPPLPRAAPSGCHSLWELAAEWTPEADPPPPVAQVPEPPAPARPSVRSEDIAAEMGLARLKTLAELQRARRRFMWENHPDRRTDLDRDLANRRVALANMLLDRALHTLRKRRPR